MEIVQVRIAGFVDTSGRPRDMADKVAGIVKELEGLKAQAVDIAEEEFKVDGFSSASLAAMVGNTNRQTCDVPSTARFYHTTRIPRPRPCNVISGVANIRSVIDYLRTWTPLRQPFCSERLCGTARIC